MVTAAQKLATDLTALVASVQDLQTPIAGAQDSDQDAITQASNANTSASQAAASATAAANSATAANTSAGQAQTYAGNASTSAGNAANSESTAATQASNASASASAAASSATAAAASATSASNNATTAMQNASAAASAASTAQQAANTAIANNFLQQMQTVSSNAATAITTFTFTPAVSGKVSLNVQGSCPDASAATDLTITFTLTNATLLADQQNWASGNMTSMLALFSVTAGNPVTIKVTQTCSVAVTTSNHFIAHLLFTSQ